MNEAKIIEINSITDVFELFERRLLEAVDSLNQGDRVSVERLFSIPDDSFVLKHNKGILGIFFTGASYTPKPGSNGRVAQLNQDNLISVVSIIRFTDNGSQLTDKAKRFGKMPAEYPEFVVDALTGIEIFSTRPVADRKILPLKTEFVDEKNGVWIYITTFTVPKDFVEVGYQNRS